MRALFIVPRFHPCPGGYESYILWLTRYLRDRGDYAKVITTTAYDLESFWLSGFRSLSRGVGNLDGVDFVRLPISYARWRRRAARLLGFLPDWRLQACFARPSFAVPSLTSELRSQSEIDVIHVGPLPYNRLIYQGLREGRRRGVPVIITPCTHFGAEDGGVVARHYTRKFQIELLNRCDAVLTLTNVERQRLIEAGVCAQKVWNTGAGIDAEAVACGDASAFYKAHGITGPIVLQLGTKAIEKGTITVVEAMRRLWASGSNAWLVLAGNSTNTFDQYLSTCEGKVPRLLNLGAISAHEKCNLLAATTVLAHPSRVESLGLVYLEAWANGKPVIAADTAVSREIIGEERDGLLVRFGDTEALSGAIARLLADPGLRRALGEEGQRKVQNRFSWKAAADRIYPFFHQCSEVTASPYA